MEKIHKGGSREGEENDKTRIRTPHNPKRHSHADGPRGAHGNKLLGIDGSPSTRKRRVAPALKPLPHRGRTPEGENMP